MKNNKTLKIALGTVCTVGVILIAVGLLQIFVFNTGKEEKEVLEYIEECKQNLLKEDSYIVVNTVFNNAEEVMYLDSIVGKDMYSEEETGVENEFSLSTWTVEDGTTYMLSGDYWLKYPKKFNEIALAAKGLDFDLWKGALYDIKRTGQEQLDLGYSQLSNVNIYEFTVDRDKVMGILSKKFNSLYYGLIEDYESLQDEEYNSIIEEYKNYIKEDESSYVFSDVKGKIGVYKDKLVLFTISLIGGGSEIHYSKIVGFDSFEKRVIPDFTKESVVDLRDFAYRVYLDNTKE